MVAPDTKLTTVFADDDGPNRLVTIDTNGALSLLTTAPADAVATTLPGMSVLIAEGHHGAFRSVDQGATWQPTSMPYTDDHQVASVVGQSGGLGQAAYSASKAGLSGLSAAIAKEYGRKGITSNVLVLGVFDTDMTRDGLSERNRDFWSSYCPAGRTGALSEVSEAILFLASDGAAFVNGAELRLTGGLDWTP